MKNQLALLPVPPTDAGPGRSTDRGRARPTPVRKRPSTRVQRAHAGASAARAALSEAMRRNAERDAARRTAREEALMAALTRPHLPLRNGPSTHRAA